MVDNLVVPPTIEAIIHRFDASETYFSEFDVSRDVNAARGALQEPTDAENLGAWSEVLAFALTAGRDHEDPWSTYFGPIGSQHYPDGTIVYSPDIAGTPAEAVAHWSARSRALSNPFLKSRYADLAWDMSQVIAQTKRDPEDARVAIDNYLLAIPSRVESYEKFATAIRALDLACLIADQTRIARARAALLTLHREVAKAGTGEWWYTVDRLIEDKKAGVTDAERAELVAGLEILLATFSDTASADKFDPHSAQEAASRLIKYYKRAQRPEDVKRLHATVAKAFEHAASLGTAMLASAFLQTAMDEYRDAGMADESRRVRILMQTKIGEAGSEMVSMQTEIKITFDEMEKFLNQVVTDDVGTSFVRIAREFQLRRKPLEEAVQKTLKDAPLMARITQAVMAEDRVTAKIGSVEDDPFGRLIHEAKLRFSFFGVWLNEALERLMEKHEVQPEHIVSWANRHGSFSDMALLLEGVRAWFKGDFAKATHILIPQIEVAMRSIANQIGVPVTKALPKIPDASVAIGMGDILYTGKVTDVLGPDLTLHLQALFADPRGLNLRNEMAHGLLGASAFDGHVVRLLIHTLLMIGVWKELAQKGRVPSP
jgi:hypothetical protein